MTIGDRQISDHYSTGDLGQRLLGALEASGKRVDALVPDDLAPVDAFHIRGRMATEELAGWAALDPTDLLLDVGSGLGGTARYLADRFGCEVVGVDVTDEYCRVAEMLSARVGLADCTRFRCASALSLPSPDAHFDVVWTEHVQMNIADKATFYGEIRRVLKPGGRFAFHDILAGTGDDLHLPVPWASDATINHLIGPDELRSLLDGLGFRIARWEDRTEESIAFFRKVLTRVRTDGWMPVGLHLLMGPDAADKFENLLTNLEEGRVRVVQAITEPGVSPQ